MPAYSNDNASNWSFATQAVHAGQNLDSDFACRNLPITLSASFVFNSAEHASQRFDLSDLGPVYSRLTNPTVEAVENRINTLEGGAHTVAFSSGQAAITAAILTLAESGSHIVASSRIYGGTHTLFTSTLAKLGIEVSLVSNPDDPEAWEKEVRDNTVAFYGETIANPQTTILDIPTIADIAHKHQVPLIVDDTVTTAAIVQPLKLGADIVVASTTKFYTGNGSGLGGVLVDGGNFDFSVERNGAPVFPSFVNPDPTYHGLKYSDLGPGCFGIKARVGVLRDTGGAISPINAWILAQGLDTLPLRIEKHSTNAQAVAEFLESHPKVTHVNYPGLPSSPYYELAKKLGYRYSGAVISFDVKGDREDTWRLIDALRLHSNVANLGDVRSLVAHPASTTHSQLSEEELAAVNVSESTVRLSVGIEDVQDIIGDLQQALDVL